MTRGAVYWHFDNKDDLLQALFTEATLPMEAMMAELDKCSDADPLGALRQMCVSSMTLLARSEEQQRVFSIMYLKRENIEDSVNGLSKREQECGDECETRMQRIFQKAIQLRQLPANTNAFLSQQILKNFFVGTVREWLSDTEAYSLEAAAPAMIDTVISGLKTCPPR
jgi:TetR/AcrR family transcriptional regulator, acrAB operon repressor